MTDTSQRNKDTEKPIPPITQEKQEAKEAS